jgi:hypothetical protein
VKEEDDDVYREMIDVDKIDAHDPNATPLRSRTIRNAVSLRLFVGTFFVFFRDLRRENGIHIIIVIVIHHYHHEHHHHRHTHTHPSLSSSSSSFLIVN